MTDNVYSAESLGKQEELGVIERAINRSYASKSLEQLARPVKYIAKRIAFSTIMNYIANNSYVHKGSQHPSELISIVIGNAKTITESPYIHEVLRQFNRPSYFIGENVYVCGALRESSKPFKYVARKIADYAVKKFNNWFYVHNVVGKNGKPMKIVKIKTMYDGANDHLRERIIKDGTCKLGKPNGEEEIIPRRRFLRKYFGDESPQLWNVAVERNMGWVGPRPKPWDVWAEFPREHVTRELSINPGLCGDHYRFPELGIKEAEEKCMDLRESRPGSADLNIFLGIWNNIIFKGLRSR